MTDADHWELTHRAVVVNLAASPARIDVPLGGVIRPLSSTLLTAGTPVSGALLGVFPVPEQAPTEESVRALGWQDFFGSRPVGGEENPGVPVLLRSPQAIVGSVSLVPAHALEDSRAGASPQEYVVRLNLWFSPAGTHCGIHREHPFIETHTQLVGRGRMQKFRTRDPETLFEEQLLAPGQTQPTIFGRWDHGTLTYPWHQYHAETDVIWLAVEYHAQRSA
ncbi:hypothetical protein D9V32_03830 [Mycetocola tolaasinivorans]|uniref:Cupin domain-containing protein n=1 Tax=Mycetocola tolaasinivorans TaxID=76635 RepID=A0A3L7ABN5_9MICO|nr:hypothetical protein D9V32_03830 [Mycetocola tolaasinivorans]